MKLQNINFNNSSEENDELIDTPHLEDKRLSK